MTKIVISGCCGAMGNAVAQIAAQREDCAVAAGFDRSENNSYSFPVYTDLNKITENFDVIVDFSTPKALDSLLSFAISRNKPMVIATTGFSEEQIAKIEDSGKKVPIFFSANMSLGVSLIRELAVRAAKVLGGHYDVEIIEKHHNRKVDAPSGTALMLANAISEALPYDPKYIYDRHSSRIKRSPHDIGIHSVRGGTIVGEHDIIFAGNDEIITLTHQATSRAIFANGAVAAAGFIAAKQPGIYTMSDIVEEL